MPASAALELTALVAAMRDDWDSNEVSRVLAAAHSSGWSFGQAAIVLIGLAVTDGAEPADLTSGRASAKRRGGTYAKVRRVTDELVVLVCKMRDDWPEAAVRREVAACYGSVWSDAQVPLEVVRLAVISDSEPRDLSAAALSPYARRTLADRRG